MKILTSFTKLITGEGTRISYTYSEIDGEGKVVSQNNRANFVVTNNTVKKHLDAVDNYISDTYLKEDE